VTAFLISVVQGPRRFESVVDLGRETYFQASVRQSRRGDTRYNIICGPIEKRWAKYSALLGSGIPFPSFATDFDVLIHAGVNSLETRITRPAAHGSTIAKNSDFRNYVRNLGMWFAFAAASRLVRVPRQTRS
jgi:hypothetical protein